MRGTVRTLVVAVLAAVALAGCSSSGSDTSGTEPVSGATDPADGGTDGAKPVAKGITLGVVGSPCVLPITFDLAADWKPKAVEIEPGSDLAALGEQGTVTMVCEIDAKPAGNIGYLRVWQGKASDGDPQKVLEAFVADDPNAAEESYTQTEAGDLAAVEVSYTVGSELLDEPKTERAFAVATPDGPVVVHLGGLDSEEHRQMLPAYELAKKSLQLG